jgi:hypothetical protein
MSEQKFICKNCGIEYISHKTNSKYCSRECRKKYNQVEHKCDYCGKVHVVYRGKYEKYVDGETKNLYCSKECANKGANTSSINICEYCRKEYTICNSFKNIQRFCSSDCYIKWKNANSKKRHLICPQCGKEFYTYHKNQIYCSRDCKAESDKKRVKCNCEVCCKPIDRKVSEYDKNTHHFCSQICKRIYFGWSKHDIDILKKYYRKIKPSELYNMLDDKRTLKAINAKAKALGLSENREWSDEELSILKENYSTMSMYSLYKLLPKRSIISINVKGRSLGLVSRFVKDHRYTDEDIKYMQEHYLDMDIPNIAKKLDKSIGGVEQKMRLLGYVRPHEIKKSGYSNLQSFVRSQLSSWKRSVLEKNGFKCYLSGLSHNLVIHHCYGFNLLFDETIENTGFVIKDNFEDYTDDELNQFFLDFFELQELYSEYVVISEHIHVLFHKEYGYGDNTPEQWAEFEKKYLNGFYDKVA